MVAERLMKAVAVIVAVATAVLTVDLLLALPASADAQYTWIALVPVTVGLNLSGLAVWVAVIAGVIGALTVIYSLNYMEPEESEYPPTRYYFFTVLFIGSMIGLALTSNLIVLYVFWEMIGFCSYILIAYYYHDPKAVRSGMKAFVVTRFGDIGLLVGILVLWNAAGTTNVFELIHLAQAGGIPSLALSIAGGGFILAAAGKSAQFPLHVWLPDAMEAPTTISALIHAACLVNAGVFVLALTYPMFAGLGWWLAIIVWMGAITALVAGILALIEWDIKRVLAYSTVSQLGFMAAAIGAGGLFASQFHLVNHAIFKALLFLCAGAIVHAVGTRDLREMGGLSSSMPLTNITTLIGVLALSGIPIFNGFWSKDLILESFTDAGAYAYMPMWILIVAAVITAAYSLRMYFLAFSGSGDYDDEPHDGPVAMSAPLVILAAGAVLFWLAVGFYSQNVVSGAEAYDLHTIQLGELVQHVTANGLLVGVTGVIIVVFFGLWIQWARTGQAIMMEGPVAQWLIDTKCFFDAFYRTAVDMIAGFCHGLRRLQTGDLNYNVAGIVFGLIVLLILLGFNLLQVNTA